MYRIRKLIAVGLVALTPALAGCTQNMGKGAAIGAAAGAGLGAIGDGSILGGAAKGAAAGAAGGFIYDMVR